MNNYKANERIYAGGQALVKDSEKFSKQFSAYTLDFSWPSVGLLNLYAANIINRKQLSPNQSHLLYSISSYLAIMAAECWSKIDLDAQIEISLGNDLDPKAIVISAKDSPNLSEEFSVDISTSLKTILSGEVNPLPFFERGEVDLLPGSNRFCHFAAGLFFGLCPWGKGPWRDIDIKDFFINLVPVAEVLSLSCSKYYRNIYPAEAFGQNPLLYHPGVVFPPGCFDEKDLFCRATLVMCKFLKSHSTSDKKIFKLALNLAKSPDQTISSAGFVIAVAIAQNMKDSDLQDLSLLSSRFVESAPSLAQALVLARSLLAPGSDWPELLQKGLAEEARRLIVIERSLGFIPLLRLKEKSISKPELANLLQAIRMNDSVDCRRIVTELVDAGLATSDIVLLGVYIDIWVGETEKARKTLASLEFEYFENDPLCKAAFLELSSRLSAADGNLKQAAEHLSSCLQLSFPEQNLKQTARLAMTNVSLLLRAGNSQESEKYLDLTLKLDPDNFSAKSRKLVQELDQAMVNNQENTFNLANLLEMYKSNPIDRSVFSVARIASAFTD